MPQFGNTQDLLARSLVSRVDQAGSKKTILGKGMMEIAAELMDSKQVSFANDVEFIAINPAELEMVLHKNAIDAAMIAEPWGTLLSQRGYVNLNSELIRKNLVSSLEDDYETRLRKEIGRVNTFPATLLVVRKEYYDTHPREVENLIVKNDYVLDVITMDTESAIASIQNHYKKIAAKSFSRETLVNSLQNISFASELDYNKLSELEDVALQAKYINQTKVNAKTYKKLISN